MIQKKTNKIPIGGKIIEAGNAREFKTGSWKSRKPIFDKEKCIGCMRCFSFCPDMAIKAMEMKDKNGNKKMKVSEIDLDYCKGCGICAQECPVSAIVMKDLDNNEE